MPTVAVNRKLHAIVLLLATLLLFGSLALRLQAKTDTELFAADVTIINRSNNEYVTHNNMTGAQSNESAIEGYQPGGCLSLQHLTNGAFVQCRKSQQLECLTEDDFWEKQCYINMTESVKFYHLGKGGGGTIRSTFKENGILMKHDHPYPKPKHDLGKFLNGVQLIINVRDPVDRFVSAFNWRSLLLCRRDEEDYRGKFPTEIEHKGRARYQPYLHPQEFCYDESVFTFEADVIQKKYNDDINKLAEALCEESSSYDQAVKHSKSIAHARLSLSEWLEYFVSSNASSPSLASTKPSNFMAITFEGRNSSLLEQTHEAIQLLYYNHGVDENTLKGLLKKKPARTKEEIEMVSHSSLQNKRRKVLGAIGECCLARFLKDDYQIIQYMIGGNASEVTGSLGHIDPVVGAACDWGSPTRRQFCRSDLQSMLTRRSGYLDSSLGSCHDIVSRSKQLKV